MARSSLPSFETTSTTVSQHLKMETHYPVPSGPQSEQKRFLPLTLVEVSHAQKYKLLERSISTSQEALPQTLEMLDRLRDFQPSIAQMFQIKDNFISLAPLRLLCESSKQLQLDSSMIKSYIALSYCWHSPDWTVADCLGRLEMGWPISTDMVHGLLNQRESSDEGIWIDQCCINQGDPLDKQLIIGSMDLIYKCARKVVAILEDVWISEAEEVLLQGVRVQRKPRNEDLDVLTRILIRILSARWFRRAWCSHEMQLSSNIVFLLPAKNNPVQLSQGDVEDLYFITTDYREQDEELDALHLKGAFLSFDLFSRTINRKIGRFHGRSLICEFSDIDQLSCSSQTDILCIALNISGLHVCFTGETVSPNERRWVLAMVALSAGDANVLGGTDHALRVEARAGTPSWLNWVDELEDTMTNAGYSKLAEPICIKSIDQYQITLDLLDFSKSTFWFPSKKTYDRASWLVSLIFKAYVNDVENNDVEDRPYWMSPGSDAITAYRERRLLVETLACSFEYGFDWMIEQMSSAPNLAEHVQQFLGDFESRFWPMLEKRVLIEDPTESSYLDQLDYDKRNLLLLYLYFILFERLFGFCSSSSLPAKKSRTSPGKEDNQVPIQEDNQGLFRCLCLDIGLGNKALVAVRSGGMKQGTPSMPVALSNGSCAGIRRLWFLDRSPEDGDDVWRLNEKCYMFTLMPIEETANAVRRRDQIVRQRM